MSLMVNKSMLTAAVVTVKGLISYESETLILNLWYYCYKDGKIIKYVSFILWFYNSKLNFWKDISRILITS